jgi:hypothetical protein
MLLVNDYGATAGIYPGGDPKSGRGTTVGVCRAWL